MEEDILKIRNDEYLRNRFIEKYKPFIAKYASGLSHRYLQYGESEELSIALLAFNESIDRFNGEGIFFEFSKAVIKSRLYDYFKSRAYQETQQHFSIDEEEKGNHYVNLTSKESYYHQLRQTKLKEEIEELKMILQSYHIDILDLYECRPKHFISRRHIHILIKEILKHEDIVSQIIDEGKLPIKKILSIYQTTEKKVSPYRKYIISVIVVFSGQFELLQEYMPGEVIKV